MDNFISHQHTMDIINFEEYNIKVLFIVQHASDLLQTLYLNIFKEKIFKSIQIYGEKNTSSFAFNKDINSQNNIPPIIFLIKTIAILFFSFLIQKYYALIIL